MRMRVASASDNTLHLVEVCPHEWYFQFPRIDQRAKEAFEKSVRHLDRDHYQEVINVLEPVVSALPEFIDAQSQLALAYKHTGQPDRAYEMWKFAAKQALDLLPDDFYFGRDHVLWGYVDNRPFFRAYYHLGGEYFQRGLVGEALSTFESILYLDPSDSLGVKFLIIRCLFRLHRPLEVLMFCERHHDHANPDLLYGRVLALYQLGRKTEAAASLAAAIRYRPLVAQELAKRTHRVPRDSRLGYTMGGADEAFYYWRGTGEFWSKTRGALAFVRRALREKRGYV